MKNTLITLTFSLHNLLDEYITIHNKRHNQTATILSLFKKKNYEALNNEAQKVLSNFIEFKNNKIQPLTKYHKWNDPEKEYFEVFLEYFENLSDSTKKLTNLTQVYKNVALGINKTNLTQSKNLEDEYHVARKKMVKSGHKLNEFYRKL